MKKDIDEEIGIIYLNFKNGLISKENASIEISKLLGKDIDIVEYFNKGVTE